MGDKIDDVIQGILERARQRKELLSEMVSKNLPVPSQQVESVDHKPETEKSLDTDQINLDSDIPSVDPMRNSDLANDYLTNNAPNNEEPLSKGVSKPVEPQTTVKFSSLTEALEAKQSPRSQITVLGTGFFRSQKEGVGGPTSREVADTCPEPPGEISKTITQRGRMALASLASKYSEVEDQLPSWEVSAKKTDQKTTDDSTPRQKGLAFLASKDSEIVKRYANKDEDVKCNLKTPLVKGVPAPAKKWTAVSTTAAKTVHNLPSATTTSTPGTSNVAACNNVPSKGTVAMTARLFEKSAEGSTPPAQTAPGVSIAKARAAFFNNLAAGSETKNHSKAPQFNFTKASSGSAPGIKVGANAGFADLHSSAPSSKTSAEIRLPSETVSGASSPNLVVLTPPPAPTYTASSRIELTAKFQPLPMTAVSKSSIILNEEKTSTEVTPKLKMARRDSWEDSKTSIEKKDSCENVDVKKNDQFGKSNVDDDVKMDDKVVNDDDEEEEENDDSDNNDMDFHENNEEEEEEEDDVEIDDEDFNVTYNAATSESQGNEDAGGIGLCSPEVCAMKDITNENIPSNDSLGNSGTAIIGKTQGDVISVIKSENSMEQSEVLRKNRKRSGSFKKPSVYISVHEYRQMQQNRPKSQPPAKPKRVGQPRNDENVPTEQNTQSLSPCAGVVMRKKNLYPDLSHAVSSSRSPATGGIRTAEQRIEELQNLINKELNVIHQTSNALNKCCHDQSMFAGSPEAVECHKLLLMSCKRREAYVIEMQKLKASKQPSVPGSCGPTGRLTISEIRLPIKSDFMTKLGTPEDNTAHYFILVVRHDDLVLFSQMISTHEGQLSKRQHHRDYLEFPNLISLNNIGQDFKIDVEIFGMSITRTMNEPGTPKKTPKKILLTPRSSRRFESPAGPMSVRTTNFVHLATVTVDKERISNEMFSLERVPRSSPLQNCMFMNIKCIMENVIEKKDFLTMFEDVSGLGAWHRRWFSLKNGNLSYWKYPEDETKKEPMGVVDLRDALKNLHVKKVTREVCARPNTFEIEVTRQQKRGDRNTLIQTCDEMANVIRIKYWLSADTKEDCESWCSALNEALMNVRAWHSDPARPTSHR